MSESTFKFLRRVVSAFPQPMSASFAYGSAVFAQAGGHPGSGMLDLVFVVPDSLAWHAANIAVHRSHYSGLAALGPVAVAHVQESLGSGVYFNTLVPVEGGRTIKYGVVSADSLVADLTEWRWLYLAGRLHKPVAWLQEPRCQRLRDALEANRAAALAAALIVQLPSVRYSRSRLLAALCGLSYGGDVRMAFAEDRGKVQNIAMPQAPLLDNLYRPLAASRLPFLAWPEVADSGDVEVAWTAGPAELAAAVACLPAPLAAGLSSDGDPGAALRRRLKRIVFRSSLGQTVKSAATAGLVKSAFYGGAKVAKWFGSLRL